jgi:hypothetical protein
MDSSAGKILQQASLQLQSAIQAVLISSSCVQKAGKKGSSSNANKPTTTPTPFNVIGQEPAGNSNANNPTNSGVQKPAGEVATSSKAPVAQPSTVVVSVVAYATPLPVRDPKLAWKRFRGHGL